MAPPLGQVVTPTVKMADVIVCLQTVVWVSAEWSPYSHVFP